MGLEYIFVGLFGLFTCLFCCRPRKNDYLLIEQTIDEPPKYSDIYNDNLSS